MLLSFVKKLENIRTFSHVGSKSLGIIGVPFSKGQDKIGVEETPKILRKAGLIDILQDRIRVKDYGDLEIKNIRYNHNALTNMKNYNEFQGCSITLIQKVQEVLSENDVYLAIGGDHSIGFGSIAGHLLVNPNTSVIWIDAHPDINLNTTSVSGNIHGMPVALLIQEVRKLWTELNIHQIAPIGFVKKLENIRTFSHVGSKSLGIIGVPFSKGQDKIGVEETPRILRKAGLIDILQDRIRVKDYGDLEIKNIRYNHNALTNMKNYNEFQGCSITLIQKVQEVLSENDVYLAIGGDHSIGFGSIAGHLLVNPNTSVIWIDAHPDINLNTTSVSGNIHGMPVALLIQEVRKLWTELNIHQIAPIGLPARELVYIGLRDIDPYESYILNKLGITFFAMDAIDTYGIAKILEMSLDAINANNKIHISFDIDALDVSIAPSTGTPVLGGLTLREGMCIMESLCATERIQGVDFVELNPRIGTQPQSERTLLAGLEIIKSIFGYKRSGNTCSKLRVLDF